MRARGSVASGGRHELAYDANDKSLLLFGGADWSAFGGRLLGDTWAYRDGKWLPVHSDPSPDARHRGAIVYDPVRGRSVLFGGQGQHGLGYSLLGDTWTFAAGQWKRSQPGRRLAAIAALRAFHGVRRKGGADCALRRNRAQRHFTRRHLDVRRQREDARFRRRATPRRYAAFAYDPDLEGCVLQGGSADDRGANLWRDLAVPRGLLPDKWVAAHPEHRLEQREEESREAQVRRRRKRAARRIAVTQ